MQFIFDVVVISTTFVIWLALGQCFLEWFNSKPKKKNIEENGETEIGLSPITLAEMHEDRKDREGDQVTSEWAPIKMSKKETLMTEIFCGIGLLMIFWVVFSFSSEAISSIRYMVHVDKICSHVSADKRAYHQGMWSDHPRLVRFIGKEVPLPTRIANAKKICGHD